MTEFTSCITFNSPPTEEVLRLDKEGFHYRGQFIADAGEAHRLMVEFLKQSAKPELQVPSDEALRQYCDDWFYGDPDRTEIDPVDLCRGAISLFAQGAVERPND